MLSLVNSFFCKENKWAKNFFWLFCIYYGYTFVISTNNVDSSRYVSYFISLSEQDLDFRGFLSYLYSDSIYAVDIARPLVSFIISRFTDDPRILYATYGMIFGYFYSRNIWYLFSKIGNFNNILASFFTLTFIFLCPIWEINNFRFWTALQVFLYGTLLYLVDGRSKGLWISVISIFIHFSFLLPVSVVLLYMLIGNRIKLLFAIFLLTAFFKEINIDTIKDLLNFLPHVFQIKINTYLSTEVYFQQISEITGSNWYIKYYNLILKIIVYVLLTGIFYNRENIEIHRPGLMNLLCFSLLFYSFCNISNLTPQGSRFYTLGNMLVFFLISAYVTNFSLSKLRYIVKLFSLPFLAIVILVSFRKGMDFTGFLTIFGNPFFAAFTNGDIPLIEVIK